MRLDVDRIDRSQNVLVFRDMARQRLTQRTMNDPGPAMSNVVHDRLRELSLETSL